MNRKLCISKRIKGVPGRVDYYLVENRYKDIKNGVFSFVYGIEAENIKTDEAGVEYVQKKSVPDLSVNREKVLEFLYMLAENDVLPVSIQDITEDFLEDFFCTTEENKKLA